MTHTRSWFLLKVQIYKNTKEARWNLVVNYEFTKTIFESFKVKREKDDTIAGWQENQVRDHGPETSSDPLGLELESVELVSRPIPKFRTRYNLFWESGFESSRLGLALAPGCPIRPLF